MLLRILFTAFFIFGLNSFATELDAQVVRLVGDEDGTKIIVAAEGRNQMVFLKSNHPQYRSLVGKLNSKIENGRRAKIEIKTEAMQYVENVRD